MNEKKSKEMLFDPKEEHDACGVGFVVNTKGVRSNKVCSFWFVIVILLQKCLKYCKGLLNC